MKIVFLAAVILILNGCASRDPGLSTELESGAIPWMQSPMTLDAFLTAIESGKSIEELRPSLGLPFASAWSAHYSLADGSVSIRESIAKMKVRRCGLNK